MDDPDSVYSRQHPWELTAQTLEMFRREEIPPEWHPPVSVQPDPYDMVPPQLGYATEEPTLGDILDAAYTRIDRSAIADRMMTDWSGERGAYQGTERNVVNYLSGE